MADARALLNARKTAVTATEAAVLGLGSTLAVSRHDSGATAPRDLSGAEILRTRLATGGR
jgi:hypothetical protein